MSESAFDAAPSRVETAALLACLAVASVFVAYDSAARWRRNTFQPRPKPADSGSLLGVLRPKPRRRSFTGATFR